MLSISSIPNHWPMRNCLQVINNALLRGVQGRVMRKQYWIKLERRVAQTSTCTLHSFGDAAQETLATPPEAN